MTTLRRDGARALLAVGVAAALGAAAVATAVIFQPTPKLVTNTTSGKNQNPSIDKNGNVIVFTSNVNHVSGVTNSPAGTFDHDALGNDFTAPLATHPDPSCTNCAASDDGTGQLFIWHKKASGSNPANSLTQITTVTGGGFAANQFPDINQNSTFIAWDSDRDHTPGSPGNADANREIFVADVATLTITQLTNTTGGGDAANRSVNWSDGADFLVFDSNRDYNGVLGCTLTDGTSACDNSDGNSEVMLYDRNANKLTQITVTTGGGNNANIRARISNDGGVIAFQSTRDFSGTLAGAATCSLADGTTACANDDNGEIMLYDRSPISATFNHFTQITNTTNTGACGGSNPSERVEVTKKGKFVTFQSKCEAQLNPTGCGDCGGNDEAFLFERKTGKILQVTISDAGFNRVPRASGSGRFIIFESNRNYNNLNAGHARTLFIIKRSTKAAPVGQTGAGQVVEDATSTLVQNTRTKLLTVNFSGGFNTTIEQFAASNRGRFFAFDNSKGVGNQEIWFLDRNK
jgi:Tol biopolymer transport system component